jgi:hypothetical protein
MNTKDDLDRVLEVADAACALVKTADKWDSGIDVDMRSWDALVKAVADYEATGDPDAAKRNRDEHGPDIPTQDLDWRDKL